MPLKPGRAITTLVLKAYRADEGSSVCPPVSTDNQDPACVLIGVGK